LQYRERSDRMLALDCSTAIARVEEPNVECQHPVAVLAVL
jgi:hypothetical protein